MIRRGLFKGQIGDTFAKLVEVMLDERHLRELGGSVRIVEKANRMFEGMSALVRVMVLVTVWLFDWSAFAFWGFQRFSRLDLRTRRRYARLWMRSKVGVVRQLFKIIRLMALSCCFDSREAFNRLGFRPSWMSR